MPVGVENSAVPVVTDRGPDIQNNTEPSKSGKALVGIIYPPLEIRNIVDKTASFTARNGPEFEARIRQHEANNPRFNFLTPTDPYHAYYLHKVKEFAEGKIVETAPQKPVGPILPQKVQDAIKAAEFVPKEVPAEFEFSADPATINAFDLDLIKLTAVFVARNGRQFLSQLMSRESRNYQFDFLKPQHSNFGYFTKLVEQYTKILIPPKDILERLRKELDDPRSILDTVKYRVEWEKHQRRIRERQEAEVEKERMAYAQIDWHDFVVVQTVDFQPHETVNLPPPCTPKDVGARLLAQQRIEATKTAAQTMEMEVESDDETEGEERAERKGKDAPAVKNPEAEKTSQKANQAAAPQQQQTPRPPQLLATQPAPLLPDPENIVIRSDYNPRTKQLEKVKQTEQKWVISPLTGEKILADKLAEHMRYNTVDSQYFVQKERELQDRQEEEPVYAAGVDISQNIVSFAERRSDIFGVGSRGAEQAMIGKKLGEEDRPKNDPRSMWDGHMSSVDATAKAAQSHVTIEEQIAQIHRTQGLLPSQDKERIGPKGTDSSKDSKNMANQAPPPPPIRPTLTATVVPVVQVAPTPVLLVQQPALGVVGGFMSSRPPFPPYGAGMPPRMPFGQGPPGQPPFFHGGGPPMMSGMPPMAQMQPPIPEDEPSAKRQKTSEDQLIDEIEWLNRFGNQVSVSISVVCPAVPDKPEWRLTGQTLTYPMNLRDPISALKTKLQESTNLPSGKQKLVFDGLFVKDSQSLAYYNMQNGSIVQLQLKERGGRKK
uniref:Splicing factor 3A subunit 1 n=1 Tax=Romanomermis culicivorax TaxID=13658 RepID=A0A915IFD6_ROMCU